MLLHRQILRLCFIVMLVSAAGVRGAHGPLGNDRSLASFKIGMMGTGDAEYRSVLRGVTTGSAGGESMIGGSIDFPISGRLALGLGLDQMNLGGRYSLNQGAVEIGGMCKLVVPSNNDRMALRLGVGLGGTAGKNLSMLAARATVELQYAASGPVGMGVEVGVWRSLAGTDDEYDISCGPLGFVRIAFLFPLSKGDGER